MCRAFPCHTKLTKGLWFFILVSLQSFDPNRLGKFKLDDYISMCIFLQSAKYSHLLPPSAITCIVHIFFELQRKQSRDGFGRGTPHLTYLVWGYRNLFGAFDTSRIGHITLDFNQFVYCGTCLSYLVVSLWNCLLAVFNNANLTLVFLFNDLQLQIWGYDFQWMGMCLHSMSSVASICPSTTQSRSQSWMNFYIECSMSSVAAICPTGPQVEAEAGWTFTSSVVCCCYLSKCNPK
jgi:hypothetical protein